MQTLSPVEFAAAPAQLERHIARMVGDEPTLVDISAVLHLLGTADDVDGVRIQSLCYLAARALGKFSADVLCAPPEALNALVRDAEASCKAEHVGCLNNVQEWTSEDGYCSPTCRVQDMRAHGEMWTD